MRVDVLLTPTQLAEHGEGVLFIVVDILRSSTTICTALGQGAQAVVPCVSPQQAQAVARQSQSVLLAGESHGWPIPGFELENSPLQCTPELVAGRLIAFVSTNAVPLIVRLPDGDESRTVIGGLVNRSAVLEYVRQWRPQEVVICCAGDRGAVAYEDVLGAGAFVEGLRQQRSVALTDAAHLAAAVYRDAAADCLSAVLRSSRHARFLALTGRHQDVAYALEQDRWGIVPRWRAGAIVQEAAAVSVPGRVSVPECAA